LAAQKTGTGKSGALHHPSLLSQERMTYIAADQSADGVAKVIYQSKDD